MSHLNSVSSSAMIGLTSNGLKSSSSVLIVNAGHLEPSLPKSICLFPFYKNVIKWTKYNVGSTKFLVKLFKRTGSYWLLIDLQSLIKLTVFVNTLII